MRSRSVAGACEERAHLLNSEAESNRGGEHVGGGSRRHAVQAGIDGGYGKGDERRDGGKQGVMDRSDTENPERMTVKYFPISDYKQKTRADQCCEEHENAEVPDAIGIAANSSRNAKSQHQSEQQTESGDCAVGRND